MAEWYRVLFFVVLVTKPNRLANQYHWRQYFAGYLAGFDDATGRYGLTVDGFVCGMGPRDQFDDGFAGPSRPAATVKPAPSTYRVSLGLLGDRREPSWVDRVVVPAM